MWGPKGPLIREKKEKERKKKKASKKEEETEMRLKGKISALFFHPTSL